MFVKAAELARKAMAQPANASRAGCEAFPYAAAGPDGPWLRHTRTRPEGLRIGLMVQQVVPFTPPFNVSGQPGISLPLWWSEAGLPVGVQLVAAMGREDVLIAAAAQLEEAQPWAQRRPMIHAFSD